jgi:hypothetical protein
MNFSFLHEAKIELEHAKLHLESEKPGMGDDFANEVEEAIQRVLKFPEASPKLNNRARCCRIHRFKYGIVYQIRKSEILILAIMHLHQKPGYWKRRS